MSKTTEIAARYPPASSKGGKAATSNVVTIAQLNTQCKFFNGLAVRRRFASMKSAEKVECETANATILRTDPVMKKVTSFLILLIIVIATFYYLQGFRQERGAEPVRQPALALLNQAGGADKVCLEADQMFEKYGVSSLTMFVPRDLRNYPAVASLGEVDGIWPGHPPFIQITVGDRLRGYRIEIICTNNGESYGTSSNLIDLAKSRIYVRR